MILFGKEKKNILENQHGGICFEVKHISMSSQDKFVQLLFIYFSLSLCVCVCLSLGNGQCDSPLKSLLK